jgi:hypothetical protein
LEGIINDKEKKIGEIINEKGKLVTTLKEV